MSQEILGISAEPNTSYYKKVPLKIALKGCFLRQHRSQRLSPMNVHKLRCYFLDIFLERSYKIITHLNKGLFRLICPCSSHTLYSPSPKHRNHFRSEEHTSELQSRP